MIPGLITFKSRLNFRVIDRRPFGHSLYRDRWEKSIHVFRYIACTRKIFGRFITSASRKPSFGTPRPHLKVQQRFNWRIKLQFGEEESPYPRRKCDFYLRRIEVASSSSRLVFGFLARRVFTSSSLDVEDPSNEKKEGERRREERRGGHREVYREGSAASVWSASVKMAWWWLWLAGGLKYSSQCSPGRGTDTPWQLEARERHARWTHIFYPTEKPSSLVPPSVEEPRLLRPQRSFPLRSLLSFQAASAASRVSCFRAIF